MRKFFIIFIFSLIGGSLFFQPIFSTDITATPIYSPILIWPEKKVVEIERKTGQFKIFLENQSQAPIHQVKIITSPSLFEISVNPSLIEKLEPFKKTPFLFTLTLPEKITPGNYSVLIKVKAQEFKTSREIQLNIKINEDLKTVIEILPKEILITAEPLPCYFLKAEPGQNLNFKVLIKNLHYEPLHNLMLKIAKKNDLEILGINPDVIGEIKPNDSASFEVSLFVPEKIKEKSLQLWVEFEAKEFELPRRMLLGVEIKKIENWLVYFYGLSISIILFLTSFFTWQRKRKKC